MISAIVESKNMTVTAVQPKSDFRPDLEGLRGIAVLLVVVYHAFATLIPGGYVGVDVFYVLSGYFITSQLWRTISAKSGRISFSDFYARRARRLIPTASVVIIATVAAAYFFIPPLSQVALGWDAVASAFNVSNLRYASEATDYLASTDAPSPLLHFWSLAIEEQFYLVWPLVLWFAVRSWGRTWKTSRAMIGARIALAAVFAASLAFSIALTGTNQPVAFFSLPTRAWELAAGGLVALTITYFGKPGRVLRAILVAAGIIGLGYSVSQFSAVTAFPGFAALAPVLGTVAFIYAGNGQTAPLTPLNNRPLRALGRWSYSLYLWHWPLLLIPALATGVGIDALAWTERVGLLVAALVLSAATYRLVESPLRTAKALVASRWLSLGVAGLFILTSATAGFALTLRPVGNSEAGPVVVHELPADQGAPANTEPTQTATPTETPTTAPGASSSVKPATPKVTHAPKATDPFATALLKGLTKQPVPSNLTPSLSSAKGTFSAIYKDKCHVEVADTAFNNCVYGSASSAYEVWLVGDSHAAQWFPAVLQIAERHKLRLVVHTRSACPIVDVPLSEPTSASTPYVNCSMWQDQVMAGLTAAKPDMIITSATVALISSRMDSFTRRLSQMKTLSTELLVLGDTPRQSHDVPPCVSAHLDDVSACSTPMTAVPYGATRTQMAAAADSVGATFIPTIGWLCTQTGCPVVLDNVLVYRDATHLSVAATQWLRPLLEAKVIPHLPKQYR
jgi:peptidoglycan/LPS O-acetylase OafA/YrhL